MDDKPMTAEQIVEFVLCTGCPHRLTRCDAISCWCGTRVQAQKIAEMGIEAGRWPHQCYQSGYDNGKRDAAFSLESRKEELFMDGYKAGKDDALMVLNTEISSFLCLFKQRMADKSLLRGSK